MKVFCAGSCFKIKRFLKDPFGGHNFFLNRSQRMNELLRFQNLLLWAGGKSEKGDFLEGREGIKTFDYLFIVTSR